MVSRSGVLRWAMVAAIVGVLGGVSFAGEDTSVSATAEVSATMVSWQATVDHAGASLSIKGPEGEAVSRVFQLGAPLQIDLAEAFEAPLADGRYSWEIRLRPVLSAWAQQQLEAAEERDEREAVRRELIESGELPAEPVVASSSFLVENGAVWAPGSGAHVAIEEPQDARGLEVAEKQLITGDLTVQFSLCVGGDCANAESYGADTIRLKENNLRIHFDDTSSSGSFPANDWRLIANSSDNGGGSFFAIEDATAGRRVFQVDAGAPASSLRVDGAGDVGIGTDNPVLELHVVDGDSPALRLEQDGSAGFAAQTWDVAGNETNFFVRDVTHGSALPFRIKPGALDDSIYIGSAGNVGFGTTTPQARVHVSNSGPAEMMLSDTTTSVDWRVQNDSGQLVISGPGDRAQQVYSPAGVYQLLFRGSEILRVDRLGNLTIAGTLNQGSTKSTAGTAELRAEVDSLRAAKQTLEERLEKVLETNMMLEERLSQVERLVGQQVQ